jgi:D-3-phosphoglycerate dehydrogenase
MNSNDGYVLLPQPIEEEALKLLTERDISVVQAEAPKTELVAPLMRGARAIVLRTGIKMTKKMLSVSEDLWTISRTGGGVDNIDLKYATQKGVLVTSSLGVNTDSVVEHCLAIIMVLFKQLFFMDREVRKGNFQIRYKNISRDLKGKSLGIIGLGRIGSQLARYCNQIFGMRILAHDPYLNKSKSKEFSAWVSFLSLEELFRESDVVSIHIPLTKDTRGIVDWKYLSLMKPESFIVNASRGGIVNEKDLIRALREDGIMGAGLDVFEKEPIEVNNPLLKMENVILTPHSAALTKECVVRMAVGAVERVIDLFDGYIPEKIANPEVLDYEKWKHLKRKKV